MHVYLCSVAAVDCTFDYLQHLDFTSYKLLFVSLGNKSGNVFPLQK